MMVPTCLLAGADDVVLVVKQQVRGGDGSFRKGECHDGDAFTGFDEVGGTAVDHDVPGAGWAGEYVGLQTVSGGNGGDKNLLARP